MAFSGYQVSDPGGKRQTCGRNTKLAFEALREKIQPVPVEENEQKKSK